MKLGKALRLVLSRLDITPYRLAKASGVGQATIGKLISGTHESASWDVVERLADGFEKLDIVARVAFIGLVTLPKEKVLGIQIPGPLSELEEIEKPENIAKVLAAADKYGLINQEAVQELWERRCISPERLLSAELQTMRAEESDPNA